MHEKLFHLRHHRRQQPNRHLLVWEIFHRIDELEQLSAMRLPSFGISLLLHTQPDAYPVWHGILSFQCVLESVSPVRTRHLIFPERWWLCSVIMRNFHLLLEPGDFLAIVERLFVLLLLLLWLVQNYLGYRKLKVCIGVLQCFLKNFKKEKRH